MFSKLNDSSARALAGPIAALAFGITGALAVASPAAAKGSLDALTGSWAGGGTLSFENGKSEKINCNGYYKNSGASLSVVIRCKGAPTNFELRSKLAVDGDKLSGTWEERTYHAEGKASGSAGPGTLRINFSGSLTGTLSMSFSPSSQSVSVSVSTKGAGIKGANVSLRPH